MSGPQTAADFSETLFQKLVPVAGLPTVRRNLLFSHCELQPLRKGEILFQAGESDDYLYYLIEGELELCDGDNKTRKIRAGHTLPLDPQSLYGQTATALSAVTVLSCPRDCFDAMLLPPRLQPYSELEKTDADATDWLQRLLANELFRRLPAPNLQQLFSQCEPLAFGRGQAVITQGEKHDSFYIIQSGRGEVRHVDAKDQTLEKIATLGPGDWFGEVGLLSECPSNVTVTMLTDGALLRVDRQAFMDLIRQPLVTELDTDTAAAVLQQDGCWLDVREAREINTTPLTGSVQLPFSRLLQQDYSGLYSSYHYIAVCDSGARSAVAALLLALQGFSVSWIRGGLAAAQGQAVKDTVARAPATARQDPLLQALRADLTRLLSQVGNAMQLKSSAERARREAERAAHAQMKAERARLDQQAEQVRSMLEQTHKLQRRLAQEKERLYSSLKRREAAVERRVNNLNSYIERRVAEERERLESGYKARESEIEQLQSKRQAAEAKLQRNEQSASSEALEAEFDQFSQALREAESEREHLQSVNRTQALVDELGDDLSEEERIKLSRYQSTQSYLTRQREQLESRARELSSAVQETLFDKQATAAVRDALLKEAEEFADSSNSEQRNNANDALRAANARYNEAEEAHQEALSAQQENADAMVQTEQEESRLLQDMHAEVEAWLQEQATRPQSPKQQAMIQRYEETMQRMKQEAVEHEEQERTRDDLLVSEINDALASIAEQRGGPSQH